MDNFFCFCFIKERNEYLLNTKSTYSNRKKFNKRRAGAHTSVVYDLVTIFKPQGLQVFFERTKDTRYTFVDLFPGHSKENVNCLW